MNLWDGTEWHGMGPFMRITSGDGTRGTRDESGTDWSRRGGPLEKGTGWSARRGPDEDGTGWRQSGDETEWSGPPLTYTGRDIVANVLMIYVKAIYNEELFLNKLFIVYAVFTKMKYTYFA
jgi:hypothetical protein